MTDAAETYHVVLLVEQALTNVDAAQVRSLHEGLDEPVVYHVLLPLEDAAARIESSMGSLAGGEVLASPAMMMHEEDIDAVRRDCEEQSAADLAATLAALQAAGATATGEVVEVAAGRRPGARPSPPLDAREAIILTRPHVVAEFFHVDWTSKARRTIGVPILHLLEHENFDEQAARRRGHHRPVKIGRRRSAESPSPAAPGPSDDRGPVAVYARVLDGESLWLAVDGATGPIGLRREGDGRAGRARERRAARPDVHLAALAPAHRAARRRRGRLRGGHRRRRSAAGPARCPTGRRCGPRRPATAAGSSRCAGARAARWSSSGRCGHRRPRWPTPSSTDDGLVVTFTDAGLAEPRLLLVDGADATVAEIEVARAGDLWTATVRAGVVPTEQGPLWTLVLADGDRRVPLVRPRNDSAMPGHATVLPFLWTGDGDDRSMVRFQYQREGRIRVNRPPTGEEDSA